MDLPGLQAMLNGGAHAGQLDRVTVDPKLDAIGYQTNVARTTLVGSLIGAPGVAAGASWTLARASNSSLAEHVAQFALTSGGRRSDQLRFPAGRELIVAHHGPAATVTVTLSAFAGGQPRAVRLPPIHLSPGATLKVAPASWSVLGATAIRLSVQDRGRSSTKVVHAKVLGRRFATVRKARLVKTGSHRYRVDLTLKLHHAPAHGWISAAVSVKRNRQVVEHAAPAQAVSPMLAAGQLQLVLPKPLPRGRYALVVRLLETTASGPVQASATVSRILMGVTTD
jgi:hypothetical protein